MARYFDAHVYVRNFGSDTLMLRLPGEILAPEVVAAYGGGDGFDGRRVNGHWLFTWQREGEPDYEFMEDEGC